jgi:hypothetical protein
MFCAGLLLPNLLLPIVLTVTSSQAEHGMSFPVYVEANQGKMFGKHKCRCDVHAFNTGWYSGWHGGWASSWGWNHEERPQHVDCKCNNSKKEKFFAKFKKSFKKEPIVIPVHVTHHHHHLHPGQDWHWQNNAWTQNNNHWRSVDPISSHVHH